MKLIFFFLFSITISVFSAAQEKASPGLESGFAAMLKEATLKGSWVPVKQGATSEEKSDSYQVVRATKKENDGWEIVSKVNYKGREIEVPIPVIVKWAGDTAVMILDNVATGGGKSYSARVLFHNDRYAGSWWGKNEPGGLLSGVITRAAN